MKTFFLLLFALPVFGQSPFQAGGDFWMKEGVGGYFSRYMTRPAKQDYEIAKSRQSGEEFIRMEFNQPWISEKDTATIRIRKYDYLKLQIEADYYRRRAQTLERDIEGLQRILSPLYQRKN